MAREERTGRRKKVDERTERLIIRTASNKSISFANIINDLCLKMSRWTINRVIKRSNILKKMGKKALSWFNNSSQRFKINLG